MGSEVRKGPEISWENWALHVRQLLRDHPAPAPHQQCWMNVSSVNGTWYSIN